MQAAAGTDLLVFGLGGVPTVRRSHTIGAGRAPMRQVRANSLGRGAFAQEVDASAWLSSLTRLRKLIDKRAQSLQFGWTLALFI